MQQPRLSRNAEFLQMHSMSMELQPPKLDVTHVLAQSGRPQMLALSWRPNARSTCFDLPHKLKA